MVRSHALLRLATRPACLRQHLAGRHPVFSQPRRNLVVLGVETSADDTCVALMEVLDTDRGEAVFILRPPAKVTCPNTKHKGIHPVEAVVSHTQHLSAMITQMTNKPAVTGSRWPDLVSVTRGPGMGGCLSVGVTTAKAFADAWDVPIVGVHHMQAHALTPFMDRAMRIANGKQNHKDPSLEYPLLTLLVSGKHTLLLLAKSPKHYRILASTEATAPALGDVLDKLARELVPASSIPPNEAAVCYPKIMDDLFFFGGRGSAPYRPPTTRGEELQVFHSDFSWQLTPPLRETRELRFDFSVLQSRTLAIARARPDMSMDEKRELWLHASRLAFEHVTGRVILAIETDEDLLRNPPKALLVSGGVASSTLLRQVLKEMLKARGYGHLELTVANRAFCTDNAVMVAYSGYKMYADGWQSDRTFAPQVKWSIEEILTGVDCWARRPWFSAITPEEAQAWPLEHTADAETEQDDGIEMTRDEEAFLEEPPRSEEETDQGAEISEDVEDTSANAAPKKKDTLDLILEQVLKDTEEYLEQIGTNKPPPPARQAFTPPASLTSRPLGLAPAPRTKYPDDKPNRPVAPVKSQARTSISGPQTPNSSDLSNVDRSTENMDGAYFDGRSVTNFHPSQPTGVKNADARYKPQRRTSESKPPTPERPDRSNVNGSNKDGSNARIDVNKNLPSRRSTAFKTLKAHLEDAHAPSESQRQTLASKPQMLSEGPGHPNLSRSKRSPSGSLMRPQRRAPPPGLTPPNRASWLSPPPQKPPPPASSIKHAARSRLPASPRNREDPLALRQKHLGLVGPLIGPPRLETPPMLRNQWDTKKSITIRFLGSEEEPKKAGASLTDKVAGILSGWLGRK